MNDYICGRISRLFAWLLDQLNRNQNLLTFLVTQDKSFVDVNHIWLAMLRIWQPESTFGWETRDLLRDEDAYNFPFSFALIPRVHALKGEATILSTRYYALSLKYCSNASAAKNALLRWHYEISSITNFPS